MIEFSIDSNVLFYIAVAIPLFILSFTIVPFFPNMPIFSTWILFILYAILLYLFRTSHRVPHTLDTIIASPCDGVVEEIFSINGNMLHHNIFHKKEYWIIKIYNSPLHIYTRYQSQSGNIMYSNQNYYNFLDDKKIYWDIITKNNRDDYILSRSTCHIESEIIDTKNTFMKTYIKENTHVNIGSKTGIVQFGGYNYVAIPVNTLLMIIKGQTLIGGETIVGMYIE